MKTLFFKFFYSSIKQNTAYIIAVNTLGFTSKYELIKNELLKNANVYSVTASDQPPINYKYESSGVDWEGNNNQSESSFCIYSTDYSFIETFNVKLINGSFLPQDLNRNKYVDRTYMGNSPIVINESAQKILGYEQPIGKKIHFNSVFYDGFIVGVVQDFHFKPLNNRITPMLIIYRPHSFTEMYIKINPTHKQETLKYIEKVTAQFREDKYPFDYYYLENRIEYLYKAEKNMAGFAVIFALLSISLAAMGMMGMISYLVKQQRKNITIRKVFGAKTHHIIFYYVKQVALTSSLASVIAGIIAWQHLDYWLQNYAYKIKLTPFLFFQAAAIAIFSLAALTTILIFKEANKSPVDNLKYE